MRKNLLIDADDTLWENNIHYERVIVDFIALMKKNKIMEHKIDRFLREKEMENVRHYGYGSDSLYKTMLDVYKEGCRNENKKTCANVVAWINNSRKLTRDYKIEFLPGVCETLPKLRRKNFLILLTKGNSLEQKDKIERSGVSKYFHELKIVHEKYAHTYSEIVNEFKLNPKHTWMIGNSPRSDINPAKAAGLGTVFIPYHNTWEHELEEIDPEGRETIILEKFSELLEYFG